MKIKIRKAKKSESNKIISLVIELAKFEKLSPPGLQAQKCLIKDAFGKKPLFNILVVSIENKIIAYAFYFFTYSSFLAKKTLYLEDIFVTKNYRDKGAGKLLFKELIKTAKKNKCGRMEWAVLDWNINAIKFYDSLGANELKDWIYYRMNL